MKRTSVARASLALLAACAAGGTMAQSNLTLFGGVDGNVTRVKAEGRGQVWTVRDSGNYVTKIGFSGATTPPPSRRWRTSTPGAPPAWAAR